MVCGTPGGVSGKESWTLAIFDRSDLPRFLGQLFLYNNWETHRCRSEHGYIFWSFLNCSWRGTTATGYKQYGPRWTKSGSSFKIGAVLARPGRVVCRMRFARISWNYALMLLVTRKMQRNSSCWNNQSFPGISSRNVPTRQNNLLPNFQTDSKHGKIIPEY